MREREKRRAPVGAGAMAFLLIFLAPALGQAGSIPVGTAGGRRVANQAILRGVPESLPSSGGSQPGSVYETADRIAAEHGVSAKLVRSIIRTESNGNPAAVSPKGAMGLMQLMPGTAREQRVSDPFDPAANIRGGVRYLKSLLQEFPGSLHLALAAYNAGPGAVRKHQGVPPFPETREFVRKVTEEYRGPDRVEPVNPVPPTENFSPRIFSGKIFFSGSPKELAAFLKRAR